MPEPKTPRQPPASSRKPVPPAPLPSRDAPRPAVFAEGSGGTTHQSQKRRAVPEPPPSRNLPLPANAPPMMETAKTAVRPRTADVIPITRARTTPPASFTAINEGWGMGVPPKRQSSQQPAVQQPAPLPGVAAAAAVKIEPPPDTIVMKSPFFEAPAPAPAPFVEPAPFFAAPPKPEISDAERWAVFEQLGLGPKAKPATSHKQMIVNTYRGLGFAVLSIIVVVLVGYIAQTAFYYVSDSWVQPMVVSKTDEKVLQLQSQFTAQMNERDRIIAELNNADRYIAVQQTFQAEFAEAIKADLSGRKAALSRVKQIAKDYGAARQRVRASNAAFASSSRKKMQQEYAAGLIDRSDMLSGKYQLAQITTSNLTLSERQAEYETRAADLEAEADALDAILNDKTGEGGAISYDVLQIKQQFEMSRLETAKAIENREALRSALARQDAILEGLRQSPYLRAIEDGANVAFVPYGNMDNVKVGAPLYGCALEMVFCSKAGRVKEILPGEVSFKHPHREKVLRGQMIVVDLSDREAGEEDVLFVGGRPLLF
jgi:hypothetical protein